MLGWTQTSWILSLNKMKPYIYTHLSTFSIIEWYFYRRLQKQFLCVCINLILLLLIWHSSPCRALASSYEVPLSYTYRQSVGLLGRVISPSQGRYLHRTTQTQNKRRQTYMPLARFEPTIPVFKRPKTFHALDHADTVTGKFDSRLCLLIMAICGIPMWICLVSAE
jgi:hypothetical protein